MGSSKESDNTELIASLRANLTPEAQDFLFVVHSAAFEGVVHNADMIEDMAKSKKVEEELPQLFQLFEMTGILKRDIPEEE